MTLFATRSVVRGCEARADRELVRWGRRSAAAWAGRPGELRCFVALHKSSVAAASIPPSAEIFSDKTAIWPCPPVI